MQRQDRVWFRETLTLGSYLAARLRGEKTYYFSETLAMRVARRLFRMPVGPLIDRIYYGDIERSTGIRRRAYEHALAVISRQDLPLHLLNPGFRADMELLASKFLLEDLFSRYEFQAMAMQFASESPDCEVCLVADGGLFPALEKSGVTTKSRGRRLQWLHFAAGLGMAPFYLLYLVQKHKQRDDSTAHPGDVLCEVDCMPIVDMFNDLLRPEYALHFYVQAHYLKHFAADDVARLGLHVHGLGRTKRTRLLKLLRGWLRLAWSDAPALSSGGVLYFDFFKSLAQGILITPVAKGCAYLTFEHMSTVKAVRNELLRATGNTSVFVPFNAYAIDHFFVPEFRYNYDVLCSPCPLLERVYRLQRATTEIALQTGAYSPHRKVAEDEAARERLVRLANFKGTDVAITILSAGVLPGNVSAERQLLSLTKELASRPGIKVFVRQKPVTPEPRFAEFFDGLKDNPSIMLTHAEYKLFDFLPVTDIFVTSNSSSAVDLCGAGGDFYAIDFWHDRDLYLWQTEVEGVFLSPEEAADTIMAWVRDDPPGTRARHHARMDALRSLTAYNAGSFYDYRRRFLVQLRPWLGAPGNRPASSTTESTAT